MPDATWGKVDELIAPSSRDVLPIDYTIIGTSTKAQRELVARAAERWGRLGRSWDDAQPINVKISKAQGFRARYIHRDVSGRPTVHIGDKNPMSVTMHEFSHAWETQSAANLRGAVSHLYSRTSAEKLRPVGGSTKELGRPDRFYGSYTGRDCSKGLNSSYSSTAQLESYMSSVYKQPVIASPHNPTTRITYATEVTSTGMEWMDTGMRAYMLAKRDAELFKYLYEQVIRRAEDVV